MLLSLVHLTSAKFSEDLEALCTGCSNAISRLTFKTVLSGMAFELQVATCPKSYKSSGSHSQHFMYTMNIRSDGTGGYKHSVYHSSTIISTHLPIIILGRFQSPVSIGIWSYQSLFFCNSRSVSILERRTIHYQARFKSRGWQN